MANLVVDTLEPLSGVLAQRAWYTKLIACVQKILVPQKKIIITVIFVTDAAIKQLHASYLKRPRITDVLSFYYKAEEGEGYDQGELFISLAQSKRQAKRYKTTVQKEVARLVIHGCLHVYGYDHVRVKDRREMFGLAKAILDCASKEHIC